MDDRDAVGVVELAGHLGQQLAGRDADRAAQAGGVQTYYGKGKLLVLADKTS